MYLNKTNGLPLRSRRYIIENFETVKKSTFFHALLYHQSYKWLICLFMPIRNFQLYGFNFPNSNLVFPYTPVLYYGRYLKWFGRTTPSRFNVNLESGWCCPFPCVGGFKCVKTGISEVQAFEWLLGETSGMLSNHVGQQTHLLIC